MSKPSTLFITVLLSHCLAVNAKCQVNPVEELLAMYESYASMTKSEQQFGEMNIVSFANNLPGFRHELFLFTKGGWAHLEGRYDLKSLSGGDWQIHYDHEKLIGPETGKTGVFRFGNGKLKSCVNQQEATSLVFFLQNHLIIVEPKNKITWILPRKTFLASPATTSNIAAGRKP